MKFTEKLAVLCIMMFFASLTAASPGETGENVSDQYRRAIAVTARTLKTAFEPNEPIPCTIAIANCGDRPIYMFEGESDFRKASCLLRDKNGKNVQGEPVPTPRNPGPEHYIERNGKQVYVVPIYEIEAHGIKLMLVQDAVNRYHKYISGNRSQFLTDQ